MSISRSGTFNENPGAGEWAYGVNGTGSLTVNEGSVLTMFSSSGGGPYVRVGRFANGDGTMTITGTGSTVQINSASSIDNRDGAGLQIGRDGAVGVVNVLDGAALRIIDPVTEFVSGSGDEYLYVGRGLDGNGTLNVQASEVEVRGNGAALFVGEDGATGTLNVSQASQIHITNSVPELTRSANLTVGRANSTGTATVDNSAIILENHGRGEAYLAVGRFGTGTMTVTGTGAADHGVFLHGGSDDYAFADIGRGVGGNGAVTVTNATLRLQNDGVGFDGATYGTGGDAELIIGRAGGTGHLTLNTDAKLEMNASTDSLLLVGYGGDGTLTANHASIDLVAGDRAAIMVGHTADSTAAASFTDGSTISLDGARAGLIVGWGNGNAQSNVTLDASSLTIAATQAAAITIGTPPPTETEVTGPGTGTMALTNNASVTLDGSSGQAGLFVGGSAGGSGALNIVGGSSLTLSGATTIAEIGTNGGTGAVSVGQGSQIVGFDTAEIGSVGGSGRVALQDGGTFGGAGSVTTLHQNGVLEAGTGSVGGDLVMDGGTVDMGSLGLSRLDVMGNANLGAGRMRLDIGASTNDSIDIAGSATVGTGTAGDTEFMVNLIEGRILAAGQTVDLLHATGGLTVSDVGQLAAGVGGANAGFSWVFGVQASHADRLALTALTASDSAAGTGGTLELAGGTAAVAVWDSSTAHWVIEGGDWVAGIATNLDVMSGTAFGDRIDARGLSSAIRINGGAGNDTFYGGSGDDIIMGGGGQDIAIYGAARAQYDIHTDRATGVTTVTDLRNAGTTPDHGGTDTLTRVELLRFADIDVSLTVDTTIAIAGRPGTGMTGVTLHATLADGSVEAVGNTGEDGQVLFSTAAAGDIRITGAKPYDPATDGTITARDALDVLRLAVGLSPSWGSAAPLDFIAADINQDGQITAADALDVLRAAVGLQSPNQPRWFFIDSDTDLSAISRSNTSVEEGVLFNPINADISGLSMTGILLGNMQEFLQ